MLKRYFGLLLMVLATSTASSQTAIWVHSTAEDTVGRQLAFELREAVRRSAAMSLADRSQDGRIYVRLVTMDPDSSSGGASRTIYSAVWTMQTFHDTPVEMFLTSYVGTCGRQRVASCAQGLAAITDEQVTDLRRMLKDVLEINKKR